LSSLSGNTSTYCNQKNKKIIEGKEVKEVKGRTYHDAADGCFHFIDSIEPHGHLQEDGFDTPNNRQASRSDARKDGKKALDAATDTRRQKPRTEGVEVVRAVLWFALQQCADELGLFRNVANTKQPPEIR